MNKKMKSFRKIQYHDVSAETDSSMSILRTPDDAQICEGNSRLEFGLKFCDFVRWQVREVTSIND